MKHSQQPAWPARHVAIVHGIGDKRIETGEDFETRPLGSFWDLPPTKRPKLGGMAFLPSLHNGHDARVHDVQKARGQFVTLVGDIDKGNLSIDEVEAAAIKLVGDCAYLIHSTANAVKGNMRWRLILPLAAPAAFSEWHDAQLAMFDLMSAQGIEMDGVTERAGQIIFLPNVPFAHDETGQPLRDTDGWPLFYAKKASSTDAPGLDLQRGPIAEMISDVRRRRAEDERLREQMRLAAEQRRANLPAGEGESPIDAFNRSNKVADLLASYGYEQSPRNADDWRSPQQTSTSYATRVIGDKFVSLSGSDAASGLGSQCASGCFDDNFDLFVHYEHGGDRKAAWADLCRQQDQNRPGKRSLSREQPRVPARDPDDPGPGPRDYDFANGDTSVPDPARRQRQRAENIAIGESSEVIPTATIHSLDEMLERFVLIKDGSQVAPIDRPQAVLALADFRNAMAASKHWVEVDGKIKPLSAAVKCWLESPGRMEAEALTFRAGGSRMTTEPGSGKAALNLWIDFHRPCPPDDWQQRCSLFVDHVEWLWGSDASPFLDWLAHIEQHPGILPHFGWVHISREHGKGRNWISSVLTRVWAGYVAASLDLIPILEGGFNGRISRKLLAIVDEINEGGNASFKHAQKLRQIVTEEQRDINPKYGRQRVEYNSCRWLMFSNHTGALPLTEDDRRFWIVAHEGKPRGGAYYGRLYGALSDPQFVASVAEFLRQRDLSNFRPGERPPLNSAKAELIAFSQSEDDAALKTIAERWPVELITAQEVAAIVGEGGAARAPVRHSMDRAGIRKLPRKVRVFEHGPQWVYAIKRFDHWAAQSPDLIRSEIIREADASKRASLEADG